MPLESTGFGRTVRSWNLSRSHTKKTVTRRTRRDARRMEATLPNGGDNAEEEAATSAADAADVMAERKGSKFGGNRPESRICVWIQCRMISSLDIHCQRFESQLIGI